MVPYIRRVYHDAIRFVSLTNSTQTIFEWCRSKKMIWVQSLTFINGNLVNVLLVCVCRGVAGSGALKNNAAISFKSYFPSLSRSFPLKQWILSSFHPFIRIRQLWLQNSLLFRHLGGFLRLIKFFRYSTALHSSRWRYFMLCFSTVQSSYVIWHKSWNGLFHEKLGTWT